MLINGRWMLCDDNVVRPIIEVEVLAANGSWVSTEFLVDSGGDCTVFNAQFLTILGFPSVPAPMQLGGVGGATFTVLVNTELRYAIASGGSLTIQSKFSGFTHPDALDMNVLGRDVMNLFAVVIDRHGDVVCMIGKGHRYIIGAQP